MAKYEPDEKLLTAEAAAEGDRLPALVELANDALGIRGFVASGETAAALSRAVAMQVNYMVEGGVAAEVYGSTSRGGRSWSFRSGGDGGALPVSPLARAVVDRYAGPRLYANTTSVRNA